MSSPEGDMADRRSLLERVLAIVTEVRAGEGVTALLMTLNLFLLLTAYSAIKPVREALILAGESGAEYKSYMGGAIAIALLFAVPAYSAFAQRVPRNRLVVGVTLFFVSNLVLFYLASTRPELRSSTLLGLVFYGWLGVFNMMVVAQMWAFANDIYTEEQGKRLFALVGLGASVGAALGSLIALALIEPLGIYNMLLVSAAILGVTAAITQIVHQRVTADGPRGLVATPAPGGGEGASSASPPSGELSDRTGAFALVLKHRYLTLLAAFSLVFTLVNTNGEYMLSRLVPRHAEAQLRAQLGPEDARRFLEPGDGAAAAVAREREAHPSAYAGMTEAQAEEASALSALVGERMGSAIGSVYASFQLWVNVLGVLLQFFLVSRLIKFLGLGGAFFILPAVALVDATLVAALPVFAILRIGKTAENALDYSLNNTLRNMLWLPTTREMKYKAKQAVDTFFVRMGDVSSALLVFALGRQLDLGVRAFAIANVVLVLLWLAIAVATVRENRRQHALTVAH